jgi:glycosyltransferase involved in cell wall biosynthesis
VHLYPKDHTTAVDGVQHEFVSPGRIARAISAAAVRGSHRDRAIYEPAWRAVDRICRTRPDVVHFHGMTLTWNLSLLLARLGSASPIVLHYHGGFPPRQPVARAIQARCFRQVEAFLFTTRQHSRPFVENGSVDPTRVVEFVETSTSMSYCPRNLARQKTKMVGDPVFLWTGRLDPIKDPMTALRGFERIAESWRGAELYMYFLTDRLLPEIKAFIATHPRLVDRVHLRGRAAASEMEDLYNSADFFLQASTREFSGCAMLEAMACGVIPVVTDIPSFRAMTADGTYGVLFPPGDVKALADGALAIKEPQIPLLRNAIREHFQLTLSFPALARQLDHVYRALTAKSNTSGDWNDPDETTAKAR